MGRLGSVVRGVQCRSFPTERTTGYELRAGEQPDAADKHAIANDGACLQLIRVFAGPAVSRSEPCGLRERRTQRIATNLATTSGLHSWILPRRLVNQTLRDAGHGKGGSVFAYNRLSRRLHFQGQASRQPRASWCHVTNARHTRRIRAWNPACHAACILEGQASRHASDRRLEDSAASCSIRAQQRGALSAQSCEAYNAGRSQRNGLPATNYEPANNRYLDSSVK